MQQRYRDRPEDRAVIEMLRVAPTWPEPRTADPLSPRERYVYEVKLERLGIAIEAEREKIEDPLHPSKKDAYINLLDLYVLLGRLHVAARNPQAAIGVRLAITDILGILEKQYNWSPQNQESTD